jgi:hypothetical protein
MAQHRTVAGSEHNGEDVSFTAKLLVPQRVYATVDLDQPSGGKPVVDRVLPEPEAQQLPSGGQAVLARRKRLDRRFDGI